MKIEHFALNVSEPVAMTDWYVQHLGLTLIKQMAEAPFTTFLADDSGRVMIEIYNNPADQVPAYQTLDPLILHLAFVSTNPAADKERLLQAGASLQSETDLADGTQLVMLRDPWGLAIQLCKRATPMLTELEKLSVFQ